MRSRRGRLAAAVLGAAMLMPLPITAQAQPDQSTAVVSDSQKPGTATYSVRDTTPGTRTLISRFDVDICGVDSGTLTFAATPRQAQSLRAAGFKLEQQAQLMDFPPADSLYHNYAEQTA